MSFEKMPFGTKVSAPKIIRSLFTTKRGLTLVDERNKISLTQQNSAKCVIGVIAIGTRVTAPQYLLKLLEPELVKIWLLKATK
jgi:hypothetical protein